jgi:hypothetical protein
MSELREPARFYTLARRVPILVGKLHDGTRLLYGPYTIIQVVGAVVTGFVMSKTTALWASGDVLIDVPVFAGLVIGVAFALGKVPHSGRNPLSVVLGAASLMVAPRGGSRRGRSVAVGRPRRVRYVLTQHVAPLATPSLSDARQVEEAAPSGPPRPQLGLPADAARASSAPKVIADLNLTGVGRLLAGAVHREDRS